MVALEEVHPDQLRANQLKGFSEAGKGKAKGSGQPRRPSAQVHTPDRAKRQPSRSASPALPLSPDGHKPQTPPHDGGAQDGLGDADTAGDDAIGAGYCATYGSLAADGNTIDDEHFFPDLPDLLSHVAERLNKVMVLGAELEAEDAGECVCARLHVCTWGQARHAAVKRMHRCTASVPPAAAGQRTQQPRPCAVANTRRQRAFPTPHPIMPI
jgi:hypothetical protein